MGVCSFDVDELIELVSSASVVVGSGVSVGGCVCVIDGIGVSVVDVGVIESGFDVQPSSNANVKINATQKLHFILASQWGW